MTARPQVNDLSKCESYPIEDFIEGHSNDAMGPIFFILTFLLPKSETGYSEEILQLSIKWHQMTLAGNNGCPYKCHRVLHVLVPFYSQSLNYQSQSRNWINLSAWVFHTCSGPYGTNLIQSFKIFHWTLVIPDKSSEPFN